MFSDASTALTVYAGGGGGEWGISHTCILSFALALSKLGQLPQVGSLIIKQLFTLWLLHLRKPEL